MRLETAISAHFGIEKLDGAEGPIQGLGIVGVLDPEHVETSAEHWNDLSTTVRSPEVGIADPLFHGSAVDPVMTVKHGADRWLIANVFKSGSAMTPALAPLLCSQHIHVDAWRQVAPHSRPAFSACTVHGATRGLEELTRGQAAKDGQISSEQSGRLMHYLRIGTKRA